MKRFVLLLALVCLLTAAPLVRAEGTTDDIQKKIDDYSQKLTEISKSKNTLANQIKIFDSQIELTALKINQAESQIKTLQSEIADLSLRIGKLDVSLNELSQIYILQIAENYKMIKKSPLLVLLDTGNFNNFLQQYKYLTILQKSNQNSLVNLETIRTTYDLEKATKSQKEAELNDLQDKLTAQKASLDKQKQSKVTLLAITKNDETKYQKLKQEAENELSSLLKAKFVGKRHVTKGDSLGLMGNSGYSFGDHLHFGVYNLSESQLSQWSYYKDLDPIPYLNAHRWPMDGYSITQGWGVTQYSYLYADKFHHGVDMVSDTKTIRAVDDGEAYFFRGNSSLGNHVKLFHSDGHMTLYLHMQ